MTYKNVRSDFEEQRDQMAVEAAEEIPEVVYACTNDYGVTIAVDDRCDPVADRVADDFGYDTIGETEKNGGINYYLR